MKIELDDEVIGYVSNIAATVKLVKSKDVSIERDVTRSMTEDRKVVIIDTPPLDLPFSALAIARVDVFLQRLALVIDGNDFKVIAELNEDTEEVMYLTMKCKGKRVGFKPGKSSKVQAPREANKMVFYEFEFSNDDILSANKVLNSMPSKLTDIEDNTVTLFIEDGYLNYEIEDTEHDKAIVETEIQVEQIDADAPSKMAARYPVSTFQQILKNGTGKFQLDHRGILITEINNITVCVLPRK